jgi:ABC-type nitrate/sulfonate/bicarbonate transport system substrate-binding protein
MTSRFLLPMISHKRVKMKKTIVTIFLLSLTTTTIGCDRQRGINNVDSSNSPAITQSSTNLSAATAYTPYDIASIMWSREKNRQITWTTSGGESGKLLTSKSNSSPSWILSSQGVVSGLVAKGEKVVIIATTYTDSNTVLPVFRKPKKSLKGTQSLFIPRSSIEFAFDKLLDREGVKLSEVKVPKIESVSFPTIATLLSKPAGDKDALDFAPLVEPFITNIMEKNPGKYEFGEGGLYELHYSVVVRADDLKQNRPKYVELLRQLLKADQKLAALPDNDDFYKEVWGREKDGKPELLTKTLTYKRSAAKLQLQPTRLRKLLREELNYLTKKYPDQLKMPDNIDAIVDPSLLQEVAPDRVIP